MSMDVLGGLQDGLGMIQALPFGVAVFDEQRHLVLSNPALPEALGLATGAFRPGMTLADCARLVAYRGVFGPGDPDAQASEVAAQDFAVPRRLRRRHPDGRTFETHYIPLPGDGLLTCVVDTSSLVAMRDEAERAASRVYLALANLRIGLAVFAPDRTLGLHNRCFAELFGLPAPGLFPGMTFDGLLDTLQVREDFRGLEGDLFLAGQKSLDRRHPSGFRRVRANGQVIDVQSDPLPDGGWSLTVADVSPLVRAEDEAKRRAGLLDSILHQAPLGIAVYGPNLRVTMVNDAYHRIMEGAPIAVGDAQHELVRRRAEAGEYGPGDPEALIRQQLSYDVSVPQMRRRQRPDGRTIDIRTAPLPDGGHISVVSDVSNLMEAQAELARKAELMASIVSHIPHGVSVYGPDRALQLVNTAYNRIMAGAPIVVGDTVEQVIEKRARAGEYGPGDPAEVSQQQRAFDNTKPQMRRRRRPNGSTIDIRTAPLPDGGHISVVTDVTPLVSAEAEVDRRAEIMDAMLANIRHGIVLWDREKRIVAANAVVTDLLAAPSGLFVPGTHLDTTIDSALTRGNLGEGTAGEARARWLREQDRTTPQRDQRLTRAGRVLEVRSDPTPGGGFVTTYTDVTESREAEDALRMAKSAAEAANNAKSRFLASMSTELRTPLTAILAEAASLERESGTARSRGVQGFDAPGVKADLVRQSAEASADAARRLLAMIDAILDVARLEAGRFELSDQVVDVQQLVRQCLRQFDSAAAAAEVALVVQLPPALPRVRGDERRLRQVLGHLVANAVRFTDAMGSVNITARPEWATGELLIEVQDTGAGIAESDLERVFEPFTQIGGPRPDGPRRGAGLGLYISRTLMRAHGGDVMLRSVAGQGTTAVLRLPADRVQDQPPES